MSIEHTYAEHVPTSVGESWITPDGRHMMAIELPQGGLEAIEIVRSLPVESIDASPLNRDEFDEGKASDMQDSLRSNGQITPGIVRPKGGGRYELIAGERRWRGLQALGAPFFRAMVREYDDATAAQVLLFENLEREDLSPIQEARIYQRLLDLTDAAGRRLFTLETIAERRFGDRKKLGRVSHILKLNVLPKAMKDALKEGKIGVRQAFLVARIADESAREKAAKEVLSDPYGSGPMTVERTRNHITEKYQVNVRKTPFDKEDPTLLGPEDKIRFGFDGEAGCENDGSCARCPWRAANNPLFSEELASQAKGGKSKTGIDADTCVRPACYHAKLNAQWMDIARAEADKHEIPHSAILPLDQGGAQSVMEFQGKIYMTGRLHAKTLVDEKIKAQELGLDEKDMPVKVPTWRQVIKGAGVPMQIIADHRGQPRVIADRELCILAGKQSRPDLFAEVETDGDDDDYSPENQAKLAEAKQARARESAIQEEIKADTVKELLDQVSAKGLGIEAYKSLCRAVAWNVNQIDVIWKWWMGKPEQFEELEDIIEAMMEGRSAPQLAALLTLLVVGDDVAYGHGNKRDFDALCAEYQVKTGDIEKRVRKAHEIAEKAAAKANADKPKMQRKGRDLDASPENEMANEEIATADIIAEGDRQREEMPSRSMNSAPLLEFEVKDADCASEIFAHLRALEVPVTDKNENGVFVNASRLSCKFSKEVGFSILLARDSNNHWFSSVRFALGDRAGSGLPSENSSYHLREMAVAAAIANLVRVFKAETTPPAAEKAAQKAREFLCWLSLLADDEAKAAAKTAPDQPKMQRKGRDLDASPEKEMANEEIATVDILAEGDRQRDEMPSRTMNEAPLLEFEVKDADCASEIFAHLRALEVPVTDKNENGMFENPSRLSCEFPKGVGFTILLARDAAQHWFNAVEFWNGNEDGGDFPRDGHVYQLRECAVAEAIGLLVSIFKKKATPKGAEQEWQKALKFLRKLNAIAAKDAEVAREAWHQENNPPEGAKTDYTEAELAACREWREQNPGRAAAAMADALSLTLEEAYAITDRLVDEKHDAKAAAKSEAEQAEMNERVKQIAAGKAKPSDFIGPKPSQAKDPEGYKTWNAERMKLKRAAAKLKDAA